MVTRATAVILLASALSAVSSSPGAASADRYGEPCGSRNAGTVAKSSTTRVYTRAGTAYGCRRGARSAFPLGQSDDTGVGGAGGEEQVGPVALAGRYVAYVNSRFVPGYGDELFTVRVRDLRTGRVLISTDGGAAGTTQATVGSLVVNARGSVAFAWSRRPQPRGASPSAAGPEEHLIWRSPDCGPRLVVGAPELDTRSLRLTGTTLSWQESGARQHAPLCPARAQAGR